MKFSQPWRVTFLQPRRSSRARADNRFIYDKQASVNLLQPIKKRWNQWIQARCIFSCIRQGRSRVPARLSCLSVLRVLHPEAVIRLMDWSVSSWQWDKSNRLNNGICLTINFKVESLISKPDKRRLSKPLSRLRLSVPAEQNDISEHESYMQTNKWIPVSVSPGSTISFICASLTATAQHRSSVRKVGQLGELSADTHNDEQPDKMRSFRPARNNKGNI